VADLFDVLAGLEGFQWDLGNSRKNLKRHQVTDNEAEEAFFNQPIVVVDDTRHSVNERRFVLHGVTNEGRGLTVIFTARGSLIRVISARDMSRKERRAYEKAT
jgi:uncharacterized DUF497 family protein